MMYPRFMRNGTWIRSPNKKQNGDNMGQRVIRKRELTGITDEAVRDYEPISRKVAREAAADGMVLLKNDGILPIDQVTKVALYGFGAVCLIKGGTGSGDVNSRETVSIWKGFRNAGIEIVNETWLEGFGSKYTEAREKWRDEIFAKIDASGQGDNKFFDAYSSTDFIYPIGDEPHNENADIAFCIISRNAGEGKDRTCTKGDYYLTNEEENFISKLSSMYKKIVLGLNVGGIIDMSFSDKYENISAIIQMSQPGIEGGNAFADVVLGKVTPSAKLTDSWAYNYNDYPSSGTFSSNDGDVDREVYTEGVYVGYRYFDSFDKPVRYGLGFGLSYTTFSIDMIGITHYNLGKENTEIGIKVCVTNTGTKYSGREVVQLYASCPWGTLHKEYRRLVGYAKTGLLAPLSKQELEIRFPVEMLASYNEKLPGWLLEKGVYEIFAGNSLESSKICGIVKVDADSVIERTCNICPPKQEINEIEASYESVGARRTAALAIFEADAKLNVNRIEIHDFDIPTRTVTYDGAYDNTPKEIRDFVDTLSTDELVKMATGDTGKGQGAVGNAGISVPGSAAQTSNCAEEKGLADIVLADGPAGLRVNRTYEVIDGVAQSAPIERAMEDGFLFRGDNSVKGELRYQYCTAFPVGTALAQTWDDEMVETVGKAEGQELKAYGVTLWLAPGMNIHRNPLCGRNFEYYSEDPVISGKMAAAMTNGVQSVKGCGTTIKHFACNSQENNRMGSDSVLSERALREIYLRGFEIAVKQAQPMSIMTSYNLINGIHAANNYDTCTKAARCEWGFKGVIMTDWTTTMIGPDCTASGCMRAGNDIVMPGCENDHKNIMEELQNGLLDLCDLKRSIARTVNVIMNFSDRYE